MIITLKNLLSLNLATVTKDNLVVDCTTIYVKSATYNGKLVSIVNGRITIILSEHAPEQLCDQEIGLVVEVCPIKSHNPDVKTMVGLASPCTAIPAPTLVDGVLTATICVATIHASSLPEGSTVVAERGQCTIASVTIHVSKLRSEPKGYSYDSLKFNFHKDIASQVEALLHPVEKTKLPPASPLLALFPTPLFGEGKSSGSWADDVEDISAPVLPRDVVPDACTGLEITPSREQNALRKAEKRLVEEQKRLVEEQKRLAEEKKRLEAEAREEAFRKESIRIEMETQEKQKEKQRQEDSRQALVKEYGAINSFIKTYFRLTQEYFLANPEECRTKIHEFLTRTVPVQEQKSVFLKTPDHGVVNNLVAIGQTHNVPVTFSSRPDTTKGQMHLVDVSGLISASVLDFTLSRHGNELMCGLKEGDGTLLYGRYAFVCSGSYDALISIRPDLADTVRQVLMKRVQMKRQSSHVAKGTSAGQGILPIPLPQYGPVYVPLYGPVYNMWGQVVGWQVVPGA